MYEDEIEYVLRRYEELFGFDLSYMKFKVDKQPVYNNGEPCYEYDFDECAGDWTKLGFIRLNPDMMSVMKRYGVKWHGAHDVLDFTIKIIAHELAHEVWNKLYDGPSGDSFKQDIIDAAEEEGFTTVYLDTVRPSKYREELFCEYMAKLISGHVDDKVKQISFAEDRIPPLVKPISFPEDEIPFLKGRKTIWTTRVSDDFDRFDVDDIVEAPWGNKYEVQMFKVIYNIDDHPFYDELTDEQIDFLSSFDEMKVLKLVEADAVYKITGAILGCLGSRADEVDYKVTEDLKDDPWLAIIESRGPVTREEVIRWHERHTADPDGKGIPYYFCVRDIRDNRDYVLFSDEDKWWPVNTKAEKKAAVEAGLAKGILEEQLDF